MNDSPKPTLRPDWTLTPPPGGPWKPYAYLVDCSDGWDLYWIPADCDDPGMVSHTDKNHIAWPFGDEDFAGIGDFEALGFLVES